MTHALPQETQPGHAGDGENAHVEELVELVAGGGQPEEEGDGREGESEHGGDGDGGHNQGEGLCQGQLGPEEQVEEEKNATDILETLKLAGDKGNALVMLDRALAQR